ncbi:enoyl-CoA hydratase/isomerase family protein [Sphingomonas sanguinis]|uniref:enoyl-CoA hydratase/isomerase family protein n=1 Tax=Sphingomonas sanguinis TaxID=33051 RepID=UPI00187CEE83|nr:enoyl-CoA hydratase/isomerase family protein [Sphingomonas sanguinis]
MIESLNAVLRQIHEFGNDSVVLLLRCDTADERAFADASIKTISAWEKVLRQIEMARAIIFFESEGDAIGPSFDLLLISDFRVLRRKSRIGFHFQNGVPQPRMSLYRVSNQIGQGYARRLCLAGATITAEEACNIGLADEAFDSEADVPGRALERFMNVRSGELAMRRRLLLEAHALDYDNALGAHLAACARDYAVIAA